MAKSWVERTSVMMKKGRSTRTCMPSPGLALLKVRAHKCEGGSRLRVERSERNLVPSSPRHGHTLILPFPDCTANPSGTRTRLGRPHFRSSQGSQS
jgi:hypothetical protein